MRFQIAISGWITLQADSFEEAKEKTAVLIAPLNEVMEVLTQTTRDKQQHITLNVTDDPKFNEGDLVMLEDPEHKIDTEGPAVVLECGYQGNGQYTVEIVPRAREKDDPDGLREVDEKQMRIVPEAIKGWWHENGWKMPPKEEA